MLSNIQHQIGHAVEDAAGDVTAKNKLKSGSLFVSIFIALLFEYVYKCRDNYFFHVSIQNWSSNNNRKHSWDSMSVRFKIKTLGLFSLFLFSKKNVILTYFCNKIKVIHVYSYICNILLNRNINFVMIGVYLENSLCWFTWMESIVRVHMYD